MFGIVRQISKIVIKFRHSMVLRLDFTFKKISNFLRSLNNLDQGKHIFKKITFKVNWNKQKTYLKINI